MKVIDLMKAEKPCLSFEVFPPKTSETYESIHTAVENVAALHPSFMSVTYGAGGSTDTYTATIASDIQEQFGVPTLAHLSCIGATKESVHGYLDTLKAKGIENILALRGDLPKGVESTADMDYHYASDLAEEIRAYGGFCIGGACYPEGHVESQNQKEDILNLKRKVDAGCEFLTTQMYFDNNIFYNFVYKCREQGIEVPIVAGIMPVTRAAQIKRIASLSGSMIPGRFRYIVDRYGDNPAAMQQAGIAYATEQIIDLYANGVNAVHIYSMNNATVARKIQENLSEILR